MTIITATEFKNNLGNYIDLSKTEDILITKNGKVVSMLTKPHNKLNILNELVGKLNSEESDVKYDQIKYDYLKEKYNL